jgi:predicted Fe-Mo cluster-binding NifX family protein
VKKVITGEVGPKANTFLQKSKIQIIVLEEERLKVSQVIKKIKF